MRGNNGDSQGNGAIFSDVDKANKERIELLNRKTKQIKEIALTIRDHLEHESKNDLSQMSSSFSENNPMIGKLMSRRDREDWQYHFGLWAWDLCHCFRSGYAYSRLCVFFKVISCRSPTNLIALHSHCH